MDFYTGTQPDELRKSPKGLIAGVAAVLLVLGGAGFTAKIVSEFAPIKAENTMAIDSVTELISDEESSTAPEDIYITETVSNEMLRRGPMILVNNSHAYEEFTEDLLSVYDNKSDSYYVSSIDLLMREEAILALNRMMDAFYEETELKNIQIVSGYRTFERQEELYNNDLSENNADSSTLVAKPGFSEHQTGLACDFNLFFGSYSDDFDGTGDYTWFTEHCSEYGFILRYPEDKTGFTEIEYEPWHFRYVGAPHASVIAERGICFEEYIDLLSLYTYDGEHLAVTDVDGKQYEIYTFPIDALSETTTVPVPAELEYKIEGDNVGNFIITVSLNSTGNITSSTTTPVVEDSSEEADPSSSEDPADETE